MDDEEPLIRVHNTALNITTTWSLEKFESRLQAMREAYFAQDDRAVRRAYRSPVCSCVARGCHCAVRPRLPDTGLRVGGCCRRAEG